MRIRFKFKLTFILLVLLFNQIAYAENLPKCVGANTRDFNNCSATVKYSDGSTFEGTFKNGMRDGMGKFVFQNGETYEGGYKEDKVDGTGKANYVNGDSYEGSYKEGKRNGLGKYYFKSGIIYEGMEGNNNANGKGKLTFPNGNFIEANFIDGKANGEGNYFKDGKMYSTIFTDGNAGPLVLVEPDKNDNEIQSNNDLKDDSTNISNEIEDAAKAMDAVSENSAAKDTLSFFDNIDRDYIVTFIKLIGLIILGVITFRFVKSEKFSILSLKFKEFIKQASEKFKSRKKTTAVNFVKIKEQVTQILKPIKPFLNIFFSNLKKIVDLIITKIDTNNKLSVSRKALLVNYASYAIVGLAVYNLFISDNLNSTYKRVDMGIVAMQYSSNPFGTRKLIGDKVETIMFFNTFQDEGYRAKVIDGNFGFFCNMNGEEFGEHNKKGAKIVRGKISESDGRIGLNKCTWVSDDWEGWKAE